jgi:hypothetical protein
MSDSKALVPVSSVKDLTPSETTPELRRKRIKLIPTGLISGWLPRLPIEREKGYAAAPNQNSEGSNLDITT